MRTHLGAVQHARARGLRALRIREHAPEAEEQVQPVGFLCVRADGRTDGRRERGAEGRREGTAAAVDSPRCRKSSGSMTSMSCCSVDSCFFMPLWSRKKFCFCGAAAASQSQPRRTGRRATGTDHPVHDRHEAPERAGLVRAHGDVDRRTQVRHALYVALASFSSAQRATDRRRGERDITKERRK